MRDTQKNRPMVSVIMAAYNQKCFVVDAIESVIKQSFKDWELIICDDASTDGTREILDRYRSMHPQKITILRNDRNSGVSIARNKAIQRSKGEYLAFLDSDDWWHEKKIELQLDALKNTERPGLVFTKAGVKIDSSFTEKERVFEEDFFSKLCKSDRIKKKSLIKENNICFSSVMIPRRVMDKVGYFEEGLSYQIEDWILIQKIAYLFDIACIPERLTCYRLHKDSYSARTFLKKKMERAGFLQMFRLVRSFTLRRMIFSGADSGIIDRLMYIFFLFLNRFEQDTLIFLQDHRPILKGIKIFTRTVLRIKKTVIDIKFKGVNKLLILFVTSKCNSMCKTCFYWKNIDAKREEMTLIDIVAIIDSLPRTLCLLITGGEPLLRDDLEEVLLSASNSKNILSVSMNTNGTMPEKLDCIMRHVLQKKRPAQRYHINISLDGFKDTHNSIRRIDSYGLAVSSVGRMLRLKKEFRNVSVSIVTVVSEANLAEITDFANFIYENMSLDFHYFEIIRGEPRSGDLLRMDMSKARDIYEHILITQERYFKRQGMRNIGCESDRLRHMYQLQLSNFFEKKPWDIKCMAGDEVSVIYENGDFSACELRPAIGNMKDCNYDLKKILKSKAVKGELDKISSDKCFCTHGCFISNSIS